MLTTTQGSWLRHCSGATSFCSGAGTAEMSRAVLEKVVNESGRVPWVVSIPTTAIWDPGVCI